MLNLARWRFAAGMLLVTAPCSPAGGQSANDLQLAAGQHVRIATHDGGTFAGYVRATTDIGIRLRVSSFTADSVVTIPRSEIDHAFVAVPQDFSARNAVIGGVVGLAAGALTGLALNKRGPCRYPGECWHIDFAPLLSGLGFGVGMIAGSLERPDAWVPVKP
jgi:hypothetical protein